MLIAGGCGGGGALNVMEITTLFIIKIGGAKGTRWVRMGALGLSKLL